MPLNKPSLKTIDAKANIDARHLKFVDIQPPTAPASTGEDFMSKLGEMAKAAGNRQGQHVAGLIVDEMAINVGGLSVTFAGVESPIDARLRDARERIAEQKYLEALQILQQLLSEVPGHHEASYLVAYCQMSLEQHEVALRSLAAIRRQPINKRLETRIAKLIGEIRSHMLGRVMRENFELLLTGRLDEAIARLRELLALDPEAGMYFYMLAGTMMMIGRVAQALEAVNGGLAVSQGDEQQLLEGLAREIHRILAREKMAPARQLFKRGRYRDARRSLHGLEEQTRTTTLWVAFDRFLKQCEAGSPDAPASRDYGKAEMLYRYLVEEEMELATACFRTNQFERAEDLLRRAVESVPHYAFCKFLYANTIYRRIGEQISSGNPPPLEVAVSKLREAHSCAGDATSDPEIKAAPQLVAVIGEIVQQFQEMEKELELQKKDAQHINKLIEEFHGIMKDAEGGIRSPEQLMKLKRRMETLNTRTSAVVDKLKTAEAKNACRDLKQAVERNLQQLKDVEKESVEAEKEAAVIKGLYDRFNSKMESVMKSGGISSPYEARQAKTFFQSLKSDIESAIRRSHVDEAKKPLRELLSAVNNVLAQLSGV